MPHAGGSLTIGRIKPFLAVDLRSTTVRDEEEVEQSAELTILESVKRVFF